jgi:hypothetical protein
MPGIANDAKRRSTPAYERCVWSDCLDEALLFPRQPINPSIFDDHHLACPALAATNFLIAFSPSNFTNST